MEEGEVLYLVSFLIIFLYMDKSSIERLYLKRNLKRILEFAVSSNAKIWGLF